MSSYLSNEMKRFNENQFESTQEVVEKQIIVIIICIVVHDV